MIMVKRLPIQVKDLFYEKSFPYYSQVLVMYECRNLRSILKKEYYERVR